MNIDRNISIYRDKIETKKGVGGVQDWKQKNTGGECSQRGIVVGLFKI